MEQEEKNILNEYKSNRNIYLELESFVEEKLGNLMTERDFFVLEVAHRTKSVSSLENKLTRKSGKYKSLYDITDLCGFRIITYFSDTVDAITDMLSEVFIIDTDNSIDKRKSLQTTEFGYLSVHYICSLKPEDCKSCPEFEKIRFEIQIRSILQHAWAEIEHDLGYKSEFGIPKPIRRKFSRVAGLLEIADGQFLELRNSIHEYEYTVKDKIKRSEADDIPLDIVSLREYINLNESFNNCLLEITKKTGAEIEIIAPDAYLEQLLFLKIETLGDLSAFLDSNKDFAISHMIEKIVELDLDIISSNMFLRYLCGAEIAQNNYPTAYVKQFVSISTADKKKIDKYIDMYINFHKSKSQ